MILISLWLPHQHLTGFCLLQPVLYRRISAQLGQQRSISQRFAPVSSMRLQSCKLLCVVTEVSGRHLSSGPIHTRVSLTTEIKGHAYYSVMVPELWYLGRFQKAMVSSRVTYVL